MTIQTLTHKEKLARLTTAIAAPLFLFTLALGVRLYFLLAFPHVITLSEADAMGYISIARSIMNTGGLGDTALHFHPFYPLLAGLVNLLVPNIELASRLASTVMGALLVVPLYLAAEELADRRTAFLSALAAALFWNFIDNSLVPLSQQTYLTLFVVAIYLGVTLVRSRTAWRYLALGFTCGALYLTRPEGILAFFYLAPLTIWITVADKSLPPAKRILLLGGLILSFFLVIFPYLNYLHSHTGRWTISGKAGMTMLGIDSSLRLLPDGRTMGDAAASGTGTASLVPNLAEFLSSYGITLVKFLKVIPGQLPTPCLLFALAGLAVSLGALYPLAKEGRGTKALQLAVTLTGVVLVLPVFAFNTIAVQAGYILPLFPLLIMFACRGAVAGEEYLLTALRRLHLPISTRLCQWALLSAALVLLFGYHSIMPPWRETRLPAVKDFILGQQFLLKETGTVLKKSTPPNSIIMSRWSNMGFYGDRKWIGLVDGEVQEVVLYAKKHNVSYLVIDSVAVPHRRPKLLPLLEQPFAGHAGLQPIHVNTRYGVLVVIYKII
jgi:hypothetical protein